MCPSINQQGEKFRVAPYLSCPSRIKRKTHPVSFYPKNLRYALRRPNRPNPTLHPPDPCVTLCRIMATMKRFLPLLLLPLLLAGCGTTAITNLTPSRLPRKDNGQYPFGVEWSSRQQSLIKDSIK